MSVHRLLQSLLVTVFLAIAFPALARPVIQIESQLTAIQDNPTWLILLSNVDDGSIIPWMHEFSSSKSYWLVFPEGRDYRIVASELRFAHNTVFSNFCNLQDGILSNQSMQVFLRGKLNPAGDALDCRVTSWNSG